MVLPYGHRELVCYSPVMRTIVKTSLLITAALVLSACTPPAEAPTTNLGPSIVDYPEASPVKARYTRIDIDSELSPKASFAAIGEAHWTSPTTFTYLTSGGSNCFDRPSKIFAPNSLSIEVVYESVGGPACFADLHLYLQEIEIPEGITGDTPVTLTVRFPAIGDETEERVEVTTIKSA